MAFHGNPDETGFFLLAACSNAGALLHPDGVAKVGGCNLSNAPLAAQLEYNGNLGLLWREGSGGQGQAMYVGLARGNLVVLCQVVDNEAARQGLLAPVHGAADGLE